MPKADTNAGVSGIVLAGGLGSRMAGCDKALLTIAERTFLDRILEALAAVCTDRLVVTKTPAAYALPPGVGNVSDRLPQRSPLAGIHAGLCHAAGDYAFVTSCDTPFLRPAVIEVLRRAIAPDDDVVVPTSGTHYQPLCAIYGKRCIPIIENQLSENRFKVDHLFAAVRVKTVPYERFHAADPALETFININTPEDLASAAARLEPSADGFDVPAGNRAY